MQTQSFQNIGIQQQISFDEVCKLLCKSRSGIYKLMVADSTFPTPIKSSNARSARVFFVASELAEWQKTKLANRTTA